MKKAILSENFQQGAVFGVVYEELEKLCRDYRVFLQAGIYEVEVCDAGSLVVIGKFDIVE